MNRKPQTLHLVLEKDAVFRVLPVLQNRFLIKCRSGVSVRNFLFHYIKLSEDFISRKVGIVMVGGRPVDDIDAVFLSGELTVAVSGAMPGLAGAVMKKKSAYASFRSQITFAQSKAGLTECSRENLIPVKLFNLVLDEAGPGLLENGVLIDGRILLDFFHRQPEDFWEKCREILLEQRRVSRADVLRTGDGIANFHVIFSVSRIKKSDS